MKDLSTLVDDVYGLFQKREGHTVSEENLKLFTENLAKSLKNAIETANVPRPQVLRMSKIGTPDRKLWLELNTPQDDLKPMGSANHIKFIYGHFIEELLLFLAKEAGHMVEGEQGEVDILGVLGHRDCKIDGITTDVKSASRWAFPKFANGTLNQDDPFGYIPQISGYAHADGSEYGAFFVANKETGELTVLKVDPVDMIDPVARIKHIQENVLTSTTVPVAKCYEPVPHGKSGNMMLDKNCALCPFRAKCWPDARKFDYANGVTYLTTVVETPRVRELT